MKRMRVVAMCGLAAAALAGTGLAADEQKEKPVTRLPPMPPAMNPTVEIQTTMGTIKAELWSGKAPKTVANFLAYAKDGFYDGTIFHRVIEGFMIQGGGFTPDMQQKDTRDPVRNEARSDVPNERGTLAMARTPVVDSATSQFFINLKDNDFLNHKNRTPRGFGYCVFGKVVEGMDVVDKIAKVKTGRKSGHQDVPVETVRIESIRLTDDR